MIYQPFKETPRRNALQVLTFVENSPAPLFQMVEKSPTLNFNGRGIKGV